MLSSFVVFVACVLPLFQQNSATMKNYLGLVPLILLGIGYSIYACALWGSVPYTVPERLLGTAFGMCTAVQNTGLTIVFPVVGALNGLDKKDNVQYFNYSLILLASFAALGFVVNILLYFDDINNRKGVLNNVHSEK